MDKNEERRIFEAVMTPEWVKNSISSESPDFICSDAIGPFLGVEITEVFPSQSIARMTKIPKYAKEILTLKKYIHSDDPINLPVGDVTFHLDGKDVTVPAIVRKPASGLDGIKALIAAISKKASKLPLYKKVVPSADLVIVDRGQFFRRVKDKMLSLMLSDPSLRTAINCSGFREIWIVTQLGDKTFALPCATNIFAEELGSFHVAVNHVRKTSDADLSVSQYLGMLGAHLKSKGPAGCRIVAGNGRIVVFGQAAWCSILSKELKIEPATLRVTPESILGNDLVSFEPNGDHPLYEAVCRHCEDHNCRYELVQELNLRL